MIGLEPMREAQELARKQWERQEAARKARDESRRRAFAQNERRAEPWPVCQKCDRPVHPDEIHWLFKRL